MRREQLKQNQYERFRDFKRQINDTYRKVYGNDIANSNNPQDTKYVLEANVANQNNVAKQKKKGSFP